MVSAPGTSLAELHAYITQTLGAPGQPSGTLQGVPAPSPPAAPPGLPTAAQRLEQEQLLLKDAAVRRAAEETRASADLARKIELEQIAERNAARAPPEDHAAASRLAGEGTPAAPPTTGNYHKAKTGRKRKPKPTIPKPTVPPTAADSQSRTL